MVSPYPIQSISVNGSSVIFVHVKKNEKAQSDDGILIIGIYNNEEVEIPIENIELDVKIQFYLSLHSTILKILNRKISFQRLIQRMQLKLAFQVVF